MVVREGSSDCLGQRASGMVIRGMGGGISFDKMRIVIGRFCELKSRGRLLGRYRR